MSKMFQNAQVVQIEKVEGNCVNLYIELDHPEFMGCQISFNVSDESIDQIGELGLKMQNGSDLAESIRNALI